MSKRKISVTLTEDEWRCIMYVLGPLSEYPEYEDMIKEQIKKKPKSKKEI